jgi:DNA polymerase (family 10)
MADQLSNKAISRQLRLFAELLLVHGRDERLADWLNGAAYRVQRMETEMAGLTETERAAAFRPPIGGFVMELLSNGSIGDLDELLQLTPAGLYDMMRIKGLGGKKLHVLWKKAKIDSVEQLLAAAKAGKIRKLAGFGQDGGESHRRH